MLRWCNIQNIKARCFVVSEKKIFMFPFVEHLTPGRGPQGQMMNKLGRYLLGDATYLGLVVLDMIILCFPYISLC